METFLCAETDIGKIIASLPKEEVEHMRRVGILVSILTQKLYDFNTYQKKEYSYYGKAAAYHDIGKAWVPRHILTKPEKLTKEEQFIIRKHPVYSRKLFDQLKDYSAFGVPRHLSQLVIHAAIYHHEWWNGTGYPHKIGYDTIPLIARITSICDAYDAMTNDRVYSSARTHWYACHELEKKAGTQFDPVLVQGFLGIEYEFSVLGHKRISSL